MENSFEDATLVATLAEKFKLVSFKPFQREVTKATLQGKDSLIIHPMGSGKSLCFQFPPAYESKKAIIVTPTISLMQDQVQNLIKTQKGPSSNLHNHPIHSATKISQCVRERISTAVQALTTSDILAGKGMGFMLSAVDGASCHSGKVCNESKKWVQ